MSRSKRKSNQKRKRIIYVGEVPLYQEKTQNDAAAIAALLAIPFENVSAINTLEIIGGDGGKGLMLVCPQSKIKEMFSGYLEQVSENNRAECSDKLHNAHYVLVRIAE